MGGGGRRREGRGLGAPASRELAWAAGAPGVGEPPGLDSPCSVRPWGAGASPGAGLDARLLPRPRGTRVRGAGSGRGGPGAVRVPVLNSRGAGPCAPARGRESSPPCDRGSHRGPRARGGSRARAAWAPGFARGGTRPGEFPASRGERLGFPPGKEASVPPTFCGLGAAGSVPADPGPCLPLLA